MKTTSLKQGTLAVMVALAAVASGASGCDDTPTTAVVQNGYESAADGGSAATNAVFKVWWVTTLFPTPIAAGETSETERTIPGTDFAYALLAPGWQADSGAKPAKLIAVKSTQKLSATVHDQLTIVVSDSQFAGNCAAGSTLGADDAQRIVERIFPGDFAGVRYDPVTCSTTPVAGDGGTETDAPSTTDGAAD